MPFKYTQWGLSLLALVSRLGLTSRQPPREEKSRIQVGWLLKILPKGGPSITFHSPQIIYLRITETLQCGNSETWKRKTRWDQAGWAAFVYPNLSRQYPPLLDGSERSKGGGGGGNSGGRMPSKKVETFYRWISSPGSTAIIKMSPCNSSLLN